MGVRGPKRGSINPANKNVKTIPFEEKKAKREEKFSERKEKMLDKDKKTRRDHFRGMTRKEIGFIIDYIMTENATAAIKKNYDINPKLASRFAYVMLNKPKIKTALEAELKKINEDISEDYITKGLFDLELMAKSDKDLPALKGAYDLMMKLKGLGSQKIINEHHNKDSFELKAPDEIKEALINTILALEDKKLIEYNKFLDELEARRKPSESESTLLDDNSKTDVKVLEGKTESLSSSDTVVEKKDEESTTSEEEDTVEA